MDIDFMDFYRTPYQGSNHAPLNLATTQGHHNTAAATAAQAHQQYWTHTHQPQWLTLIRQPNRNSIITRAGTMGSNNRMDPKPRLAKEEVEVLEREFTKNPKPNSTTKRDLADRMRVDIPRINNWFQNRRAKEKQVRKTREFEEQQARKRTASESKSPEDQDQGVVSEFYGLGNYHQPMGLSSAAIGDDGDDGDDFDDSKDDAEFTEPLSSKETDDASSPESPMDEEFQHSPLTDSQIGDDSFSHMDYVSPSPPANQTQDTPELESAVVPNSLINLNPLHNLNSLNHQTTDARNDYRDLTATYQYGIHDTPRADGLAGASFDAFAPQQNTMPDGSMFGTLPGPDYFSVPVPMPPTFPSESLPNRIMPQQMPIGTRERHFSEARFSAEDMSPSSTTQSPPPPPSRDSCFKAPPPPAGIASRRNIRGPAPLGLGSLRGLPLSQGPKTGIDMPRRIDAPGPVRRIASATGSLSGRILKNNGSGPRSPFLGERGKEAILHGLQTTRSPVLASLNSALSPVSPEGLSQQHQLQHQHRGLRENTVSTNGSDDDQGFASYGPGPLAGGNSFYKVEHNLKTPPGTPGLTMNFHEHMFSNPHERAWSYIPHDEPLATPSLCSHGGSEVEFNVGPAPPGYVASQPPTPSFPPNIGPTYSLFNNGLSNAEYTFPDSYATSSVRSSPGQPKAKTKQFQFAPNVTPQDFNQKNEK